MCTFNTIVLPRAASLEAFERIALDSLHLRFVPQDNRAIEAAIADDARSFVKDGYCDCGMGLARLAAPPDAATTDRELRRLKAQGWSDARIARWREQREAGATRRQADFAKHGRGAPPHVSEWTATVRRLLDERVAAWVGLFTHEYRGDITTERVVVREVRRFVGASEEAIGAIEEDVAFVFGLA